MTPFQNLIDGFYCLYKALCSNDHEAGQRERETGTDRQTGEVQVCLLQAVNRKLFYFGVFSSRICSQLMWR